MIDKNHPLLKEQTEYSWLLNEGAPRMLVESLALYGTDEVLGARNNPVIMSWAKEVGTDNVYTSDAIPWCGLFIWVVAKRAGKVYPWGPKETDRPLWAYAWEKFGTLSKTPMLGDVLVFNVPQHVTLYIGEDTTHYHCLGGNQSDSVNVRRFAKSGLKVARRPEYKIGQPANVRPVYLKTTGIISNNTR